MKPLVWSATEISKNIFTTILFQNVIKNVYISYDFFCCKIGRILEQNLSLITEAVSLIKNLFFNVLGHIQIVPAILSLISGSYGIDFLNKKKYLLNILPK